LNPKPELHSCQPAARTTWRMEIRPSTWYSTFVLVAAALLLFMSAIYPALAANRHTRDIEAKRLLVQRWQLTDLCLFPEARYTRHISQADLHSAFQDHPGAKDHFPAGSMVSPPFRMNHFTFHQQPAGASDAQMD
jgi:hypothetical protein